MDTAIAKLALQLGALWPILVAKARADAFVDIFTGILIIVAAGAVFWASYRIREWDEGPSLWGYPTTYIAIFVLVAGLAVIASSISALMYPEAAALRALMRGI